MSPLIYNLLDWSEVWALIIPLLFIFPLHKLQQWQKPIAVYIIIAFILNSIACIISHREDFPFSLPWENNLVIYNIHSVVRFICFSYFFILLKQNRYPYIRWLIPVAYVILFLINFLFYDQFFATKSISGNLLAGEAFLLLVYCMLYYLSKLKDEVDTLSKTGDFWIVTGISIYVVINFFVFLFYVPMLDENNDLADNMWSVHNVAYIILCLFLAKGFYGPFRKNKKIALQQ